MRSRLLTPLGIAGLLLATSPLFAQTQKPVPADAIIVPPSSIARPGDAGKFMHTHIQLINPASGYHNDGGLGPGGGMTPAQMCSFYGDTAGGSGIIAIVDAYHYATALNDFNTFSSYYGLPQESSTNVTASTNGVFQIVYAGGSQPPQDSTGSWESEEALDIEWAHAMAPYAKIVLVEANSASGNDLFNAVLVAGGYTDGNGKVTKEVSMSWGSSEFSGETGLDWVFTNPGVVYFASTGDHGTAGGTEYPSTSPNVVAVGGTHVSTDNNGNFTGESGWSGSGGGLSSQEARPFYQNNISGIVGGARGVPDISADADPTTGASVYDTTSPYGGWIVVGGTSLSSPLMAGLLNSAEEWWLSWTGSSQRELDTLYYNLAATGYAHYRDITSGSNGGYSCLSGYDLVTGIGTPIDFFGLADFFLVGFSPNSATAYSSALTLTFTGTSGWYNYDNSAVISWNGTALPTTFVSDTELQATVPASALTTHGYALVTVSDAGDYGGGYFAVNAPAPVLSKLAPTSVLAGGPGFTLTATSTTNSFVQDSVLAWNGTALATTFVSPTKLQASVPASAIANHGSAKITVVSPAPGGGTSVTKSLSIKETSISMTLNSLVQNGDGSYSANVTLKNAGYLTANNLQITASTLGAAATSNTLPIYLGNMPAGGSVSGTLNYPSSAGAPGAKVTLKVVTKFTGGSSTDILKVTLP
ncbi:MAG TPA: hypothetical protein VKT32_13695 [Chthonomonadaceae bacterium]|nr:hypothetical protein [Chthonomonadaceae bacterium]